MRSKIRLIIVIFLVIIAGGIISVYLMLNVSKNLVKLKNKEYVYELGEKISSNIFDYAKIINKYDKNAQISCSNLKKVDDSFVMENKDIIPIGNYECVIKIKRNEYVFTLSVKDTISPKFTKKEELIEIEQTSENVDLLSYFEVEDYSKVSLKIDGYYNFNEVNKYDLKVIATDEAGNSSNVSFVLNVKEKPKEEKKEEKKTSIQNHNTNNNSQSNNSTSNKKSSESNTSNNVSQSFVGYRKDISNSYVNQVNQYRKSKGLSELPTTSEAQNEADRRAKELINNYSHDGAGYGFGEVIGHGTAGGDFITAWKNSPTHNATLLREENTAIAASVYEVDGHWYTVISFKMNY